MCILSCRRPRLKSGFVLLGVCKPLNCSGAADRMAWSKHLKVTGLFVSLETDEGLPNGGTECVWM